MGFAKDSGHNWLLLRCLRQLTSLGLPVLVGASRKRFLGQLLADSRGELRPPAEREAATAAVSLLAADDGAWAIRVHEPRPTRDALAVLAALRGAPELPPGGQEPAAAVLGEQSRSDLPFGHLVRNAAEHG